MLSSKTGILNHCYTCINTASWIQCETVISGDTKYTKALHQINQLYETLSGDRRILAGNMFLLRRVSTSIVRLKYTRKGNYKHDDSFQAFITYNLL